MSRRPHCLIVSLVVFFSTIAAPVHAYVDLAPTLAKLIRDSQRIVEIEVVRFSPDDAALLAKEARALKGKLSSDPVRHRIGSATAGVPRQITRWAAPGSHGIMLVSGNCALVCVGNGWYQVAKSGGWWALGADRPDLPLAYYGDVSHLASAIGLMLAGKDAVITVVRHGGNDEAASFDLALNRTNLPALAQVERIHANMSMPMTAMAVPMSGDYLIGIGPVDEADISFRIEQLQSPDATARASAADDLRWLGPKAGQAVSSLTPLLKDASARVRVAAAAALLRIQPTDGKPLAILRDGLHSASPAERSEAAVAAGLAGPVAGVLSTDLAALLKDTSEPARLDALLAISTLGSAAREAAPAVASLLDEPSLTVDAADALGHIGAASQPALKQLAPLLKSPDTTIRWAAVRAMSQIGSPDAHPAVDFMIHALPGASEVDGYNMMIYLALLGPVAHDAIPTIRGIRIKNPVLPTATLWAIEPDKGFPWQARPDAPNSPGGPGNFREGFGGGPGGPGGFGGPPLFGGGNDEGPEFARYIYASYVHELGHRLEPAAVELAKQIASGKAGNVPLWGYEILKCGAAPAADLLTSHVADKDKSSRERAAVALGYMGTSAASARHAVADAIERANDEQEKRLLSWCLRELNGRPAVPAGGL